MHQGKFITFRSVPHAEFEALRRFGDYVFSPQWNILQRIEPNGHEYRIFDEEHEPFHWDISVTPVADERSQPEPPAQLT